MDLSTIDDRDLIEMARDGRESAFREVLTIAAGEAESSSVRQGNHLRLGFP